MPDDLVVAPPHTPNTPTNCKYIVLSIKRRHWTCVVGILYCFWLIADDDEDDDDGDVVLFLLVCADDHCSCLGKTFAQVATVIPSHHQNE